MTVIGEAFIEVKPDADGFGPAAEKSVSGSMAGVAKKAVAAFGAGFATAKLVGGVKAAVEAGAEAAQVQRITDQLVKQSGEAAGISAEGVADLAEQISNLTGIDDEAIQSASNTLLAFSNIKNAGDGAAAIFDRTQQAAVDMAAALGTDVAGATAKLGKALNDPEKGLKLLARSGVQLTEQQQAQVEALQAQGDTLGAQQVLLDALEAKFKGTAEAAADPMQKLQTVIGNVQESIGQALLPALGPAADAIGKLVQGIAPALEALVGALGPVVDAVANALAGLGPILGDALDDLAPALESLGPVVAEVANALGPVLAEIGKALAVLVPPLAQVATAILKALGPVIARIVQTLGKVIAALAPILAKLAPIIEKVVGLLGDALGTVIDALLDGLEPLLPIFQELLTKVFAALEPVLPILADAIGKIAVALAEVLVALLPLLEPLLNLAILLIDKIGAPALILLAEAIALVADVLARLLTDTAELIVPVVTAVTDFFSNIEEMPQKFAAFFTKIFDLWKGFVADILGFVEDIVGAVLGIPERLLELHTKMRELFVDVGLAIINGILEGIASATEFVTDLANKVVNAIIDFINDAVIGGLNDLLEFQVPLPLGRKITINPPDLPTIPNLAQGGIVEPQPGGVIVRAAEAGRRELVTPLPDGVEAGLAAIAAGGGARGGDTINVAITEAARPRETASAVIRRMRSERYLTTGAGARG